MALGAPLLALLLAASAPGSAAPVVLGQRDFSRGFDTRQVQHSFQFLSSRDLRYSSTGDLEVQLSTSLFGRGLGSKPRAALLDGYVALDLPPALTASGPLRLYFRDGTGTERLLYSAAYPPLPRYAELGRIPARDAQPAAWLAYLDRAAKALDPRAAVSAAAEPLHAIPSAQTAFWVIPADFRQQPLIELFREEAGTATPTIIARLPIRIVADPGGARVGVHAGALSCAAAVVQVTPDLAPPGSLRLDELEGSAPAEPDPAAKAKLLVYSCEWLSWDDSLPVLPAAVRSEPEQSLPVAPETEPDEHEVELVTPTKPTPAPAKPEPQPVKATETKPAAAKPAPPKAEPQPSKPDPKTEAKPAKPSADKTQPADKAQPAADVEPSAPKTTTARQVELGTLPAPVEEFEAALKPITGAAGQRSTARDSAAITYDPTLSTAPGYATASPGMVRYYGPGGPDNLHVGGQVQAMPAPPGLGTMVLVPAGKFLMGTDAGTPYGDADELPQHEVEVAAFQIDRYPVTNRQFGDFVLRSGYSPEGEWDRYSSPAQLDMPVRCVSWNDANAYTKWAGKRLPTEAEWEKAARGTDGRLYPWGNDWNASILPRGEFSYELVTAQKAASPYGVMALAGVLWQWTSTPWHEYPYNPDARGEKMILRGGAYSNGRNIVRCANRYFEMPGTALNTFTFRCAKDVP